MSLYPPPHSHSHSLSHSSIRVATDITPSNVHETIPVAKTIGLDRTELLADVDPRIWTKIIPSLLDWTCDPNWPCTPLILRLLVSNPITVEAAIPHVEAILRQDGDDRDDEHQNVLLYRFVSVIEMRFRRRMLDTLRWFRENSTVELERDWEWDETVEELISEIEAVLASEQP